ncbi:uncharacterized protein STAUR_1466 [Stigmatella aurantiaca DW4/3-1]|uniref:Uncharacterized protein n=1 Tax=Stigmatella aurantiaca (strain DW4/3-1) TaxID=378806 RepID=E3FM71_STIAD|nr:uncharacterized protein STAUR_1466 [Stigmatella aurantiaca DW4/3-1]
MTCVALGGETWKEHIWRGRGWVGDGLSGVSWRLLERFCSSPAGWRGSTSLPPLGRASQSLSPCEARTTSGGFRTILHFNNPLAPWFPSGDGTRDLTIRNELVRLIDNVPKGSVIRGTYALADNELAIPAALVRAQNRGQVSIDGGEGVPAAGSAARLQLDQITQKKVCPSTAGCISSNAGGDTSTTTYVVWVGSYNMTNGPDGNAGFNNSMATKISTTSSGIIWRTVMP